MKTIEAVIDKQGNVRFLEKVEFKKETKALVTLLDEESEKDEFSLVGSVELLDEDLDEASKEISQIFNDSINKTSDDIRK